MPRGTIYPHDEISSISSDGLENHSRCSPRYLLQTRRRGNLFLIIMMMIALICGITIPLAVMLSSPNDAEQLGATTENADLNSTTNTTTFSTKNLYELMNSTVIDTSFVSNSTLKSSAN